MRYTREKAQQGKFITNGEPAVSVSDTVTRTAINMVSNNILP